MSSRFDILSETIIGPLHRFRKNYLNTELLQSGCDKLANFIYNSSKETAIIMLFFNAVSVISSHLAQIRGLKKSKRENKDYLITQEKKELGLDLVFSIIPPFLMNNALRKTFESGKIITKSADDKIRNTCVLELGLSKDDLYNTSHIRPVRETILNGAHERLTAVLNKYKNMPEIVHTGISKVKDGLEKSKFFLGPGILPTPSLEDHAIALDTKFKDCPEILKDKGFYNGKAYDDLSGMINGWLIIATLAYTIIASNVLLPILKNKLAKREYDKQLAKMGETRESIKRKKRFEYNNNPIETNNNIFTTFSINNIQSSVKQTDDLNNFNREIPQNEIFKSFSNISNNYGNIKF